MSPSFTGTPKQGRRAPHFGALCCHYDRNLRDGFDPAHKIASARPSISEGPRQGAASAFFVDSVTLCVGCAPRRNDIHRHGDSTTEYNQHNKLAPVSGMPSTLDYEVTFVGEKIDGRIDTWVKVLVGATSLCPCSKAISEYGAHNQRSHITMNVKVDGGMWLEDLIEIAEQEASCELWGVLKREDEKYVTERAYENPKFVEDLVRDVAARLTADPRVRAYSVESENFESIHNHSAYARIDVDKDA
ncbi:MAG: GTP cyclohydrolase I FolE2 [Actinobacteria bacterium]|nr:GTP cyclohydrolase I FolE2 [Actinomycetota bacterium]